MVTQFEINNNWVVYAAQINQHFVTYNVTDDNKKRAMLLASLSEEVFGTLMDLYFTLKPETNLFEDIFVVM